MSRADVCWKNLAELADLRSLLWEKHFRSLPPEEQRCINEGTHPSFSSAFASEAAKYAESLQNALSPLDYVANVSLGAYHGDELVLTVWLKRQVPWSEYRMRIPELFRGFQVFVGPPAEDPLQDPPEGI